MLNSNSIRQQLNEQFDRIFNLKYPIIPNSEFIAGDFNNLLLARKREILASKFLAKDDQGYILKEGNLPNPEYILAIESLEILLNSFNNSIPSDKINPKSDKEYLERHTKNIPKNFRELFKQNAFAETQEEIDNLKLINW